MNKKTLVKNIFFMLLISIIAGINPVFAEVTECEYSEAYKAWLELSDEEKENIAMPEICAKSASEKLFEDVTNYSIHGTDSIPSSYNITAEDRLAHGITSVKNQGSAGTCWTFAAMSTLESYMNKNKSTQITSQMKNSNDEIDLSEAHVDYATSSNGISGADYFKFTRTLHDGGNLLTTQAYFMSDAGAVSENKLKFDDTSSAITKDEYDAIKQEIDVNDYSITSGTITKNDDGTYKSSCDSTTITKIKNLIMSTGSVDSSVNYLEENMNDEKTALYYNTDATANHEITIVGWDDDYATTNFKEGKQPTSNGAWLIKNSHGSSNNDNGYFYVSYEDTSICYGIGAITDADTNVSDNLYQNETYGPIVRIFNPASGSTTIYAANIFTTKNPGKEELTKVVVGNTTAGSFDVYLIDNYTETDQLNYDNIESNGTLLTSGAVLDSTGFKTITLQKPTLIKGSKYAILVKYNNNSIGVAKNVSGSDLYNNMTISSGVSYYSTDGVTFADLGTEQSAIASIKASTNDITYSIDKIEQEETKYYIDNATDDGLTIKLNVSTSNIDDGEKGTFYVKNPSGTTIKSDGEFTITDNKGVIEFTLPKDSTPGNYSVTAKYDKIQTSAYTLTIDKKVEAINVKENLRTNIHVNETISLGATTLPENATDTDLTYTVTEGEDIIEVSEDGKVTGLKIGTAKVLIKNEISGVTKEVEFTVLDSFINVKTFNITQTDNDYGYNKSSNINSEKQATIYDSIPANISFSYSLTNALLNSEQTEITGALVTITKDDVAQEIELTSSIDESTKIITNSFSTENLTAGSYVIKVYGYYLDETTGTLEVTEELQTISFDITHLVDIKEVSVDTTTDTIIYGSDYTMKEFTLELADDEDEEATPTFDGLTYSSSNTNVAKINAETNEIEIVGVGETTIKATSEKKDISNSYQLIVKPNFEVTNFVETSNNENYLNKDGKAILYTTAGGKITADYTITAPENKYDLDYANMFKICKVTESSCVDVTSSFTIDNTSVKDKVTISYDSLEAGTYQIESKLYEKASPNEEGNCSIGTKIDGEEPYCSVPVTTYSKVSVYSFAITAINEYTKLELNKTQDEVKLDNDSTTEQTIDLTATATTTDGEVKINPETEETENEATFPGLVWTSSNENVATVENGKVTIKSNGKTTITVKPSIAPNHGEPKVEATYELRVVDTKLTSDSVTISSEATDTKHLYVGSDGKLIFKYIAEDYTLYSVNVYKGETLVSENSTTDYNEYGIKTSNDLEGQSETTNDKILSDGTYTIDLDGDVITSGTYTIKVNVSYLNKATEEIDKANELTYEFTVYDKVTSFTTDTISAVINNESEETDEHNEYNSFIMNSSIVLGKDATIIPELVITQDQVDEEDILNIETSEPTTVDDDENNTKTVKYTTTVKGLKEGNTTVNVCIKDSNDCNKVTVKVIDTKITMSDLTISGNYEKDTKNIYYGHGGNISYNVTRNDDTNIENNIYLEGDAKEVRTSTINNVKFGTSSADISEGIYQYNITSGKDINVEITSKNFQDDLYYIIETRIGSGATATVVNTEKIKGNVLNSSSYVVKVNNEDLYKLSETKSINYNIYAAANSDSENINKVGDSLAGNEIFVTPTKPSIELSNVKQDYDELTEVITNKTTDSVYRYTEQKDIKIMINETNVTDAEYSRKLYIDDTEVGSCIFTAGLTNEGQTICRIDYTLIDSQKELTYVLSYKDLEIASTTLKVEPMPEKALTLNSISNTTLNSTSKIYYADQEENPVINVTLTGLPSEPSEYYVNYKIGDTISSVIITSDGVNDKTTNLNGISLDSITDETTVEISVNTAETTEGSLVYTPVEGYNKIEIKIKKGSASNDATLKSLTVDEEVGTLTNIDDDYVLELTNELNTVTFNAEANNKYASITGTTCELNEEEDTNCEIKVTAEDGTSKTYTITVKQPTILPGVTGVGEVTRTLANTYFEFSSDEINSYTYKATSTTPAGHYCIVTETKYIDLDKTLDNDTDEKCFDITEYTSVQDVKVTSPEDKVINTNVTASEDIPKTFDLEINPETSSIKEVEFEYSEPNIAEVKYEDNKYNVYGLSRGTTVVTIRSKENNEAYDTITVNVYDSNITKTGMTGTGYENYTGAFTGKYTKEDVNNITAKVYKETELDPELVNETSYNINLENDGEFTLSTLPAMVEGTYYVELTGEYKIDDTVISSTTEQFEFEIKKPSMNSITMELDKTYIKTTDDINITITLDPDDLPELLQKVNYVIGDEEVIKVEDGKIIPLKEGISTIKACSTITGYEDVCSEEQTIYVVTPLTMNDLIIKQNDEEVENIETGKEATISGSFTAYNIENLRVSLLSKDEESYKSLTTINATKDGYNYTFTYSVPTTFAANEYAIKITGTFNGEEVSAIKIFNIADKTAVDDDIFEGSDIEVNDETNVLTGFDQTFLNGDTQITYENLIDKLNINEGVNITVKNGSGTVVESGLIGTGYTIEKEVNGVTTTYTVLIYGDISGNGIINSQDLLMLRRYLMGTYELTGVYKDSANAYNDPAGTINSTDLLMMRRHLMGTNKIVQVNR